MRKHAFGKCEQINIEPTHYKNYQFDVKEEAKQLNRQAEKTTTHRWKVEMVRRFVKEKNIRVDKQRAGKSYTHAPPSRQPLALKAKHVGGEPQSL